MSAWRFILVLLLAFGARVFRLDAQSLWSDEGNSVFMTGRSFVEILQAAAGDIHPPLYYLLLRYWSAPAGTGEFAVRFLSLVFGVLLVALIFKLGERLAGRDAGLAAAFLAALSPLLIYYSQEARMYMQMAALATLSVLLAMKMWEGWRVEAGGWRGGTPPQPSSLHPLPYIVATTACLYTQYFSFTIVLFENLAFALVFWRAWRYRRAWLVWIASQLAIAILYLPWLLRVLAQLNTWPATSEAFSLPTLAYRIFSVFSFGLSSDLAPAAEIQALFIGLLFFGLAWRRVPSGRGGGWRGAPSPQPSTLNPQLFILLYLAVPIGIMYYLSLSRPMYNPKFLLLATPPFDLLLGLGVIVVRDTIWGLATRLPGVPAKASTPGATPGVVRLRRTAGTAIFASRYAPAAAAVFLLLALGGMAYPLGPSLAAYYLDPKYARDDYRGLSRYVEASARPGDAIILNAPSQSEIFGYYYRGSLPVLPLPKGRPIDERATETDLRQAAQVYRRLWVVFWAEREVDPAGFLEGWLNQSTFRAANRWFGNVRLVLYSVPVATPAGTVQHQVGANFADKISLLGVSLNRNQTSPDHDIKSGEALQLTLFWQAQSKMDERYTVFTHLIDPQGHIWGQRDAEPGSGARPTAGWTPGMVISDNYGIPVLYGTPPGEYYVETGLYLPKTRQRLLILGRGKDIQGDRVLFGPLKVGKADAPPPIDSLDVEHRSSVDFGPLRLVGYDFHRLGFERADVAFRQGEIARLALYWQAVDRPGRNHNVVVQLLDANGQVAFAKQNSPADGNYPTALWDKGEIALDQHKLPLNLPPGKYRLVVGLADDKGVVEKKTELREMTIRRVEG